MVKLSLCTPRRCMGGVEVYLHFSAGEWTSQTLAALSLGQEPAVPFEWEAGLGHLTGIEVAEKRTPNRGSSKPWPMKYTKHTTSPTLLCLSKTK